MIRAYVISEDHTLDEHILKPIIERFFVELNRKCRVEVIKRPRIRGVEQATHRSTLERIFDIWGMADMFILVVDRDCETDRRAAQVANAQQYALDLGKKFVASIAIEELEVWALALHRTELKSEWPKIRVECDPKEAYFDPFVRQNNWHTSPGKGRKAAMEPLRNKWDSLKHHCPEIRQIEDDLRDLLVGA